MSRQRPGWPGREHLARRKKTRLGRARAQRPDQADAAAGAADGAPPARADALARLQRAVQIALQQAGAATLYFIDLDRYGRINEALGQAAGDAVLRQIGARLRAACPNDARLLRWGGDEFVLLLPRHDSAAASAPVELARRLLTTISQPLTVEGLSLVCTASIGLAHAGSCASTAATEPTEPTSPSGRPAAAALLAGAEAAMRRAKLHGGARFEQAGATAHATGAQWTRDVLLLEARLHALAGPDAGGAAGGLELHYQPQVQTGSGRPVGLEALLRWRQADGSLWAPGKFLAVAEQCGAIVEIGAWVLHEACAQMMRWQAQGLAALPVSVNVSARQCLDQRLLGTVRSALARSGLPAGLLNLEITETAALADLDTASRLLGEVRALGVGISMDDFGTGYSSLAHLGRLPISQIKIDQSFVQGLDHGAAAASHGAAIVRATIDLAHRLGLPVVAEGVESAGQLSFLASERCDFAQGYFCARPLAVDAAERWLRAAPFS